MRSRHLRCAQIRGRRDGHGHGGTPRPSQPRRARAPRSGLRRRCRVPDRSVRELRSAGLGWRAAGGRARVGSALRTCNSRRRRGRVMGSDHDCIAREFARGWNRQASRRLQRAVRYRNRECTVARGSRRAGRGASGSAPRRHAGRERRRHRPRSSPPSARKSLASSTRQQALGDSRTTQRSCTSVS